MTYFPLRPLGSGSISIFSPNSYGLNLRFKVLPGPSSADLLLQLNVAYLDAILGAQHKVDTVHGAAWLTIPPGTQHGATLKLEGAGLDVSEDDDNGQRLSPAAGAHYFEIAVKVPVELSSTEARLLEKLREHQNSECGVQNP